MQLQQSPVFWKIFRDTDSTAPPFAGLEPIIYYIILCLIRALLLLLHMAIITCNTVFSENPLRAVGYFVYIHIIRWRKLLIYRATHSIFLNVILFSVFVYRDVALLCYYIVGHAAHETCTYMCRKWVRFDETVTISHRLGGWKTRRRAPIYNSPTDRILFYTFRVFPRNRHEFLTTVNAPGCSYCCVSYTHRCYNIYIGKEHATYNTPVRVYKRVNFMGFYYTRTNA